MINFLLLAYQLENYDNIRFFKFIYSHPKFRIYGSKRQNLVRTNKLKLIFIVFLIISVLDILLFFYIFSSFLNIFFIVISIIIWFLLFPIYIIVSNFLILPIDKYLKNKIIKKAKEKLKRFKNIKIIGITGSYGKTGTKNILATILNEKYKVLKTQGNKNTPLGISEIILKDLDETYDIFIVEMGAYKKGNIKELCDLVNPSIGILTGITFQHLERFGSLENIIDAKFELLESLPENGLAVVDITNKNIISGLEKKSLEVKEIIKVGEIKDIKYLNNLEGIEFELENNKYKTKLIAPHSVKTINFCVEVAKNLKLSQDEIKKGIEKIEHTKHRMEPIYNKNTNVWIIDDSYNGNIESVKSTSEFLKNINHNGRKIYLSPGLVELGEKASDIHKQVGEILSGVVDVFLLIENAYTKDIIYGLEKGGFKNEENIKIYKTTNEAHDDLKNILKSGDLIVFQNDWTDNYF